MDRFGSAAAVAVVVGGGMLVGALTSIGQGVLPEVLAPMANSAGSWCLAAFGLAATTRRPWLGALLGAAALFAMVIGYALASEVAGHAAGSRLILFWGVAAAVVGPPVGVAAAWARTSDPTRFALAAGLIAGILVGEAIYGLTFIAATTPVAYWVGQLLIGLSIVGIAAASRRHVRQALACVSVAVVIAAAVLGAYAANPIQFL